MGSRSRAALLTVSIGLLVAASSLSLLLGSGCAKGSPSSTQTSPSQTTVTSGSATSPGTSLAAEHFAITVTGPATIARPVPSAVVLAAPWGTGTAQFGLYEGTPLTGPGAMAVDSSMLAIADGANSRVQIYHLEDNGKARLARTIRLPNAPGGLNDIVIDPKGTIYILKGQGEVLGLTRNSGVVSHYAIDTSIGAQRLYLDGFNLFVQGADGKCYGVAAIYPGQSSQWAAAQNGLPVHQPVNGLVSLVFREGKADVSVSTFSGQVLRQFQISSPNLPLDSASILGVDWVENIWVLLHIPKAGWNGTECLLAVAVSPEGRKVGELRLPLDQYASEDIFLDPIFPFTIYEMHGTTEGLTVNHYAQVVEPVTTTTGAATTTTGAQ